MATLTRVLGELESSQPKGHEAPTSAAMFLEAMPFLFGSDRHEYQEKMAGLLRGKLNKSRLVEATNNAATKAKVEATKAELESHRQGLIVAQESEQAARGAVQEKASVVSEKNASVKEEKRIHLETKAKTDEMEQEREELQKARDEVKSVIDEHLDALAKGALESEEARDDAVKTVCAYVQKLAPSKALLASLPKSLLRPTQGPFSKYTIDETSALLSEKCTALTAKLDASTESFRYVKAESLGAWAIADVAREKAHLATQDKAAAAAALESAIAAVESMKAQVTEFEGRFNTVLSEQAIAEARLRDTESALEEFEHLEDGDLEMPAAKRMKLTEKENLVMSPTICSVSEFAL